MSNQPCHIFITGASGFVGRAVLVRLVQHAAIGKIHLLIRSKGRQDAKARLDTLLSKIFAPDQLARLRDRIVAVPGDLTEPGLGLSEAAEEALVSEIDQILHVGASTDFGADLEDNRRHNVLGTRHVCELALRCSERGRLVRLDYVSTAYVSGNKRGVVSGSDLERGQSFSNSYEQSKFEAEQLVRDYAAKVPVTVHRPSIIVGDSSSGFTPHFKVLYWPLLLLARNMLPMFACNPSARLDVVPVDYVADALTALITSSESIGHTYHLTAGLGREIYVRDVLRDAYRFAGIKRRPFVRMWVLMLLKRTMLGRVLPESFWDVVDLAMPYYEYLRGVGVRFDDAETRKLLEPLGIASPSWDCYKQEVLRYCLVSRWGKRLPQPEYTYYARACGAVGG